MIELKNRIVNRDCVVGTMLSEFYTPNIIRLIKCIGYEFVFIDCEHGYFDLSQVANLAAVGKGFGIGIIVRVPSVQREFITKVLDIGVDGLLLPQIDNVELAKQAVYYAKYCPEGKRGLSTTRAHTDYNPPSVAEYVKKANKEIILLAQIESKEAVDNSYEIASLPGIDGIIVGPNDMAADMGKPGQTFTEEMQKQISTVIDNCVKLNKPCGIVDSNIDRLHFWQQKGMSLFCIGSEIHMMLKGGKENIKAFCSDK